MKAKIQTRIGDNRAPLQDVIPLDTPYLVFLDPSSACQFQCAFCPTGCRNVVKAYRKPEVMSIKTYWNVIENLKTFNNRIKTLRLYKDGEPLINIHLPYMVELARQSGMFESIDTTTNGVLLLPETSEMLVNAGLDKIVISVEGLNAETYKEFSKYNIDYTDFIYNINYFYKVSREHCLMHIKIAGDNLAEDDIARFYDMYGNMCDTISIEYTAPCWPNFAVENVNRDKNIYGNEIPDGVDICPYIFYSMAINASGTVSLCFLDWKHEEIIGNLGQPKQDANAIWNGDTINRYRRYMLDKKRNKILFCRDCGQLKYGQPDSIDAYAKRIKERIGWDE